MLIKLGHVELVSLPFALFHGIQPTHNTTPCPNNVAEQVIADLL